MKMAGSLQLNRNGSATLIVALMVSTAGAISIYWIASRQSKATDVSAKAQQRAESFYVNEISALHAKALRDSEVDSCSSNDRDANGRCILRVPTSSKPSVDLSTTDGKRYWSEDLDEGTKHCGASEKGSTNTKACIYDRNPCANKALRQTTKSKLISFPANKTVCPWGTLRRPFPDAAGNLFPENNYTNARYESPKQSIADLIPENGHLCDVRFSFKADAFHFTDGVMVTFDDIILIASDNWTERPQFAGNMGYLKYDWPLMRNTPVGLPTAAETGKFRNLYGECPTEKVCINGGTSCPLSEKRPVECSTYCVGQNNGALSSVCHMPAKSDHATQTTFIGPMELEIKDPTIFLGLAAIARKEKRYDFQVITYGDDNSTDCMHGPIDIEISFTYAELAN